MSVGHVANRNDFHQPCYESHAIILAKEIRPNRDVLVVGEKLHVPFYLSPQLQLKHNPCPTQHDGSPPKKGNENKPS
jgi:hypothetical protein